MNLIRVFSIFVFLLFLSLLLSSFFFYPSLLVSPYVFLVAFVFIYNIIESYKDSEGLFAAVLAGFFVDVFSSGMPVGFYMLLFFIFAYFIKLIQKKYVGISAFS